MSEDIDFIKPELKRIQIPHKQSQSVKTLEKGKQSTKSFSIQKSFISEPTSQIHEQLRPQVNELKRFYKLKKQKQKKQKQQLFQKDKNKQINNDNQDCIKSYKQYQNQTNLQGFKVDQSGQLRDKYGNLVFMKTQKIQLKINKKKQLQKQTKQLGKKQKIKFHQKLSRNFLDRNLVVSGMKKRIRRSLIGLQLLEQGSYQPYKKKLQIDQISDLNQATKKDTDTKIIRKRNKIRLQFSRQVPKYEWWDSQILNTESYTKYLLSTQHSLSPPPIQFQSYCNLDKLKNEVVYQHVGDSQKKQQKITIPVYLTKDERKKLKRKNKKQKLIQKNDMIKLGIISPDKPKLTLNNMAIVMKNQFIIDPSRVQLQTKKQIQQRLNTHIKTNEQRKLTKSQKKMKILKKLKKDSAKQCKRVVFKLNILQDPIHIFKINMNAKQLALNGFILTAKQYHHQPVIVMAEGGQKAIKFFKNLMLNRIRWNQKGDNRCVLIWQGQIQNSKIGKWQLIEVGDQSQTIKVLTQRGVQNFRQYIT